MIDKIFDVVDTKETGGKRLKPRTNRFDGSSQPRTQTQSTLGQDESHIGNIAFFLMPYLLVRESYMSGCCLVDGLPLTEFRILGEKCSTSPDMRDEKNRRMEFPTNTITILNSLEMMGYKVVTSGAFSGSSFGTFSHKEFIWTLHRSSNDIDHL